MTTIDEKIVTETACPDTAPVKKRVTLHLEQAGDVVPSADAGVGKEIALQIEKIDDGMHGRRILHDGIIWYEKKASRKNFWSRNHFTLRNQWADRILAEYRTKDVVLRGVDRTLKVTYAKIFKSFGHQGHRFVGEDGNEYMLTGHAFTNKLDIFLIDKPDQMVCSFLATLWMRSGFLFAGNKRGELILHEPATLVDHSGGKLKPTAVLDDLLVHCFAYTDIMKAHGNVPVSGSSDSE